MEKIVPRYIEFVTEANKSWQEKGEYYKAGAGILPICEATGRMLLFLRTPKAGDEDSGRWATAGGMMDENELKMNVDVGSRECALREFKEETGQKDPFDRLMASYVYKSPDGSFNYYNFVGLVPEEFEPKLNEEHSEYKWFSLGDLKLVPRELFHFGLKLLFANDQKMIMEYAK
jgi:8-oxo-dGTP pyrophosphatase MutT (NUDIX family)